MASPFIYPGGLNLAGTVFANGPETLQRDGGVYLSGDIQWVDTIDGDNGNDGTFPNLPVATLAQAVTNSAANGVIVIGEGSSESLGSSQALNLAGLSIFGCGSGSSRPRYTCTGAVNMFAVTGAGTWIEGIYFPASTAVATDRIGIAAANCMVKDCYFECGANDTNPSLIFAASGTQAKAEGCSFVVTASRPAVGIGITAAVADSTVVDCVFDGGSYGWTNYALLVSAAATRIKVLGGTYINHSDIGVSVTATSYQFYGIEMDGTSRVLLVA